MEPSFREKFLKKRITVISGGSVQILATLQFFASLNKKGWLPELDLIVANSAGALATLPLIFDSDLDEAITYITEQLSNTTIVNTNPLKVLWNLVVNGCVSSDEGIRKIIYGYFDICGVNKCITFKELHENRSKALVLAAVNSGNSQLQYFSPWTTPNVSVIDGVLATTTFTPIFPPHAVKINGFLNHFTDGGVVVNYPYGVINRDSLTCLTNDPRYVPSKGFEEFLDDADFLGVCCQSPNLFFVEKHPANYTYTSIPLVDNVYKILVSLQNNQFPNYPKSLFRNTAIVTTDKVLPASQFFNASPSTLKEIIKAGKKSANQCIKTYIESKGHLMADIDAFYR